MAKKPTVAADEPTADKTQEQAKSAVYETNRLPQTSAETNPSFGPPAQPNEIGSLGPYRVIKELGRGGMGAVYLGFDERLTRRVALKVLLPHYAAIVSSKQRFLREARAAATITHDNIVTIYEADERDGTPYMAMQLLQGHPLDEYLKQKGRLDLAEVLRIGRETALGLAAAHAVGLVHRDIKPGNLWLEAPSGRVKILDFGLAKPTQDERQDTELTATGAILGTPAYMAPEQALGEKADARADLFSLGVVLYRLVTGHGPFHGSTVIGLLAAVVKDEPTPVQARNPAVPDPLAKLIHQLLEKNPNDRPASAEAVAEKLRQIELGTAAAIALPVQAIPLDGLMTVSHITPGSDPFAAIDATEPDEVVHRSSPSAAPVRRTFPKWPLLAVGLLVAALAVVIPQLLKVTTPKGTLIIETTDPDVEVVVKQGSATIVDRTKNREIALGVGTDYQIDLVEAKEGLKLSTKTFEITKNGKTTVKVWVEKPNVAVKPAAKPVGFRVVNGVTTSELREWTTKLPEGYRPTYVSTRVGSIPQTYDAIALPVHGEYYLEHHADGKRVPVPAEVHERMLANNATAVMAGEQELWTTIWVRGYGAGVYFWFGWDEFIHEKDREAMRGPTGARPTSLAVMDGTNYTLYGSCTLPVLSPEWESKSSLNVEQLADAVTKARARGWRPELLGVDTMQTPTRFRATFCKNAPEYEWDFSTRISSTEYQKQLDDRGAKGFVPRCVCSSLVNGQVEYVVLWLKNPPAFDLTPANRKALQAVLNRGAKLEVETSGLRLEIPGGAILPECPMAVLNIDCVGNKAITDAAIDEWKDLPPIGHWLRLDDTAITDKGLKKLVTCPGVQSVQYLSILKNGLTDSTLESVGKLPILKLINVHKNPITSDGFRHLKNLKLSYLFADYCEGVDGSALEHLQDMTTLRELWMFHTNLSDAGFNMLGRLTNLELIFMSGAKLTDNCVDTLVKFPKLKKLQLGGTSITDTGFARLKGLPALAELNLDDGTKVTADGLRAVKDFPAIDVLRLINCADSVTDTTIQGLQVCKKLKFLELYGCKVTDAGVKQLAAAIPQCRIAWDGGVEEPRPEAPPLEVHGVTKAALAAWVAKLPRGFGPTWITTRTGSKELLFDAVAAQFEGSTETKLVDWNYNDHAAYDELKKTSRLVAEAAFLLDGKYQTVDAGVKDGRHFDAWYGNLDFVAAKIEEGLKSQRDTPSGKERWMPNSISAVEHPDGTFTYSVIATWQPDLKVEWRPALSAKELTATIAEYRKKGWRPHLVNTIAGTSGPTYLALFTDNVAKTEWDFSPGLTVTEYETELLTRKEKGQTPRCVTSHEADGKVSYTVVWEASAK